MTNLVTPGGNIYRLEGDLVVIRLTKGYPTVVDAADFPAIAGRRWYAKAHPSHSAVYASSFGRPSLGEPSEVGMHRLLLGLGDLWVDHIDGDGLNNRKSNLRQTPRAGNARNRKMNSNNAAGFKGVRRVGTGSTWRARVTAGGKTLSVGCFGSPEEAAAAYDAAATRFHGEFAKTNLSLGLLAPSKEETHA